MSYRWATESGINFPIDSVDVDILLKSSDAPFIYYVVCRDGSQVVQDFYDTTGEVVEEGILTLTGKNSEGNILKVHFPLDFVKHWCQVGPGEKVNHGAQS